MKDEGAIKQCIRTTEDYIKHRCPSRDKEYYEGFVDGLKYVVGFE